MVLVVSAFVIGYVNIVEIGLPTNALVLGKKATDQSEITDVGYLNEHFALIFASVVLVAIIWVRPIWNNVIAFQDFRFLIRAMTFFMINFLIAQYCMKRGGDIPWSISAIVWAVQFAMWIGVIDDPVSLTDFRILAMMVNLVNIMALGKNDNKSNFHAEVVLLELLDIRTQRLLTADDKTVMTAIRLVAISVLLLQYIGFVDIIASALFSCGFFMLM